jgi:hypothetical protein
VFVSKFYHKSTCQQSFKQTHSDFTTLLNPTSGWSISNNSLRDVPSQAWGTLIQTTCVTFSSSNWSSCSWSWCTPDKCMSKTHTKLLTPCMLGLIQLCQRRHPITLSIFNNGPALCKSTITRVASTKRNNEKKRGMSNPTTSRATTCILVCNEQPGVCIINYRQRDNRWWFHDCSTSEQTQVSVDPGRFKAWVKSFPCPRHPQVISATPAINQVLVWSVKMYPHFLTVNSTVFIEPSKPYKIIT